MPKPMLKTYFVTHPNGSLLIQAHREADAISHVAKATIKAEKCNANDVVRHMKDGLEVQVATAAAVTQGDLPLEAPDLKAAA